jgi:polysaccharide pyruvyl transferase WcaK-like protein
MGIFAAERHMFSSDDAVSLPATPLGDGRLDALVKGIGAYVAVQLHYWHMPPAHVERLLGGVAEALDRMVEKRGCSVLMIPMTFGDRARSDRALLEELRRRSAHPGRFHMAPDDLKPQQLKYLFGQASSAVVSRHHAMVFSITSGVHCAAIVLDPYYRMKLRGVADDYPGLAVLLEESEATPTSLLGALEPPFQIVAHE